MVGSDTLHVSLMPSCPEDAYGAEVVCYDDMDGKLNVLKENLMGCLLLNLSA